MITINIFGTSKEDLNEILHTGNLLARSALRLITYACEVGAVRTMKREHIPETIVEDVRNYCFLSSYSLKDIHKAIRVINKELKQQETLGM